jgi:hypothetical protein
MTDLKAHFCLALECSFILDLKEWNNYKFVSFSTIIERTTPFTSKWGWVLNTTLQSLYYFKGLYGGDFATKIPLVALNKLHMILIINDKVLDEQKNQQIQVHPLIPLNTYYHMRLICDYFGHYWRQMVCCHVSQYVII